MKIYYVANARMPNEKAHGIQIAKMCEALLLQGIDLVLVVPGRRTTKQTLKEFYTLRVEVPMVRVPVVDLYRTGRVGFALSSLLFMVGSTAYLLWKKLMRERFAIYTIDMDNFAYSILPLIDHTYTEMHTPKDVSWVQRFFFSRVAGVIATNHLTKEKLMRDYSLADTTLLVEPNGVDLVQFGAKQSQVDARQVLQLPLDKKIALYVGRFYPWKGLEILPGACTQLPPHTLCYVVGGTEKEFIAVTGAAQIPNTLLFAGGAQPAIIPTWLQAADALLVLGSAKNEDSNKFTSPMKLFEYMASGVPIVASNTPANTDVLGPAEASFYEPDNATALAGAITTTITSAESAARAEKAFLKVQTFSWELRAKRVLAFIASADTLKQS